MTQIPQYPFFEIDGPEWAFGCSQDKYLQIDKNAAEHLFRQMPTRTAALELISTGAIVHAQWPGAMLPDLDPEKIHHTMSGLIRSFAVSHEIKEATIAVALYRWFPIKEDQPK